MDNLTLKYFPVKGRCEPIFLMLEDANIPYKEEIISLGHWMDMRKAGQIGPPDYPNSSLPVLSFVDQDGAQINLAETNAILVFLDRLLVPRAYNGLASEPTQGLRTNRLEVGKDHILAARQDVILEMSMFYLNRVFQTTSQKDWITGDTRSILGKAIAARFLQGLEYQLELTPGLIPGPDDALSGPISAAFVAISFTLDIFPIARQFFPRCSELFDVVSQRERIREYYSHDDGARLRLPWTVTEYGKVKYIEEIAAAHLESDRALFESSRRV